MSDQTLRNVPPIRFKGHLEPWQEIPVGKLIRDHVEKTVVQNQYPVLTSSQRHGIVRQTDYFADRQVTTDRNIGYLVLPRGYFSYRSRSDNDSFIFNRNDILDKGIISYYYPVFEVFGCDSDFFLRRINYGLQRQISVAAEGTGQRVLTHSRFKQLTASYPCLSEQKRIGAYFRDLDRLISLHQRKHERLVALRRAMLQKMLPRAGANTPEIRFNGFSGDWVQIPLRELTSKIGSGKTPRGGSASYVSRGIPLIRSQNIIDNLVDISDCARISFDTDEEMANSRVKKGDVLLNITGASIGRSAVYSETESANVNQHVCIIRANGGFDPQFIHLHLFSDNGQQKIFNNQAGGAREGLNFHQIGGMIFTYPDIDEQKKIGAHFRSLNEIIIKHATQTQKLRQVKSACLRKMFV